MFENVNWGNVDVVYNDFNINKNVTLDEQLDSLKEDLFQAKYGKYIIDVGYTPNFDENGEFKIVIIQNENWDDPLMTRYTRNLKHLETVMQKFVDYANL